MGLDTLKDGVTQIIAANPVASTAIAAGTGLAVGTTAGVIIGAKVASKKRKKKTKKKRKKTTKKNGRRRKKTRRSKGRRTPRTAGKGKDRSTKRIRYTKNGQPYVIMRSGKARFIKKSSAKRSHKRKGGRY